MKKVIGLTGGMASGKSTVSKMLKERGCYIADADAVSRGLLEPGGGAAYKSVAEIFPAYVNADGSINRAGLAAHVFSDKYELKKLNSVMHPAILGEIYDDIRDKDGIVIIDAPLLIETGLNKICDRVWLITADRQTRVERAVKRSGISSEEAEKRIDSQLSDEAKAEYADRVIDNSGSVTELYETVGRLLSEEQNGAS